MNLFHILLASNFNAVEHMAQARERLQKVFPSGIRFSDNMESLAVSKNGLTLEHASTYLNAVCIGHSELTLDRIQSILKEIEREMGREKGNKMVVIDLDLVEWNGEILRPWDAAQFFYQECLKRLNHG